MLAVFVIQFDFIQILHVFVIFYQVVTVLQLNCVLCVFYLNLIVPVLHLSYFANAFFYIKILILPTHLIYPTANLKSSSLITM